MSKLSDTISSWSKKKKITISSIALTCVTAAIVIPIVISSMGTYKGMDRLKRREETQEYTYDEYRTENVISVIKDINRFSHPLFTKVNKKLANRKNSAYSPASMFYALAMLSKVTSGQDKQKILEILGTNEGILDSALPKINSACNSSFKSGLRTTGRERVDNSIWLDQNFEFNEYILEELAKTYYADSFLCDFHHETKKANKAISEYAKDCTDGLLNPSYNFDSNTVFVLLNTLFFEDIWNREGLPLDLEGSFDFSQYDGSKKNASFYST